MAGQARKMLADLGPAAAGSAGALARTVRGERYMSLDYVSAAATSPNVMGLLAKVKEVIGGGLPVTGDESVNRAGPSFLPADWDEALRTVNRHYDRLAP